MRTKPKAHELLRFFVPSHSGKVDYLVDLTSYEGNGKCDCMDFRTRKEPKLAEGGEGGPNARCKHINSARQTFCDMMIQEFIKRYPSNDS